MYVCMYVGSRTAQLLVYAARSAQMDRGAVRRPVKRCLNLPIGLDTLWKVCLCGVVFHITRLQTATHHIRFAVERFHLSSGHTKKNARNRGDAHRWHTSRI